MAYRNVAHYGKQEFEWDPAQRVWSGGIQETAPGYLPMLFQYRDLVRSGQAKDYEAEQYRTWEAQARALPTRDVSQLKAGWQGESQGHWGDNGWQGPNEHWWEYLDPMSPDVGPIMLQLRDKLEAGTATRHERELYQQVLGMAQQWDYRASVPQASDAFNPLGDQFFGALGMLGMGAGAGAALAPLAAGGALTLGGAAGLAGTAGGFTGMMGQALDMPALSKAGTALGLVGGLSGIGSLLSKGISSVGDVLSLGKGLYGTATKAMGLASSSGGGDGGSSTGGGGGMDTNQLGGILGGIVGAVGTGLSLADAGRYMEQLKQVYGQEQNIRKMIDEAYALAAARYDVYYAQTQEEYRQKQEAYSKAQERYETYYQQTQQEQAQKQAAYAKGEGQKDEDRGRQIQTWQEERAKVDQNFNARAAQAQQERDLQLSTFGTNREQTLANYQQRMAEAEEDRQREIGVFNENWSRHLGSYDRAVAEAGEERAMDVAGYQARHAIGANLRDPAALKAGAEALYQPLSELARGRISQNAQAEMASRGVTGGGMYANRLSAEAFAPHEQALWNNALNAYLQGQNTALSAYGNVDLARAPEYREYSAPHFTNSPQWTNLQAPNLEGLPTYTAQNVPRFDQAGISSVPGSVGYVAPPGVPGTYDPGRPTLDKQVPKPYSPGGTQNTADLVGNITKLLAGSGASNAGGIAALIAKLFQGGGSAAWADSPAEQQFIGWNGNETQQPWYDPSSMDWSVASADPFAADYMDTDFGSLPYDDWSW